MESGGSGRITWVAVDGELGRSPSWSSSSPPLCLCRICHEEEEESTAGMEAPCACSGTLKFAHRGCIQRWCDEKGSTVCEICLQKFEPGYSVPLRRRWGSLEVPRQNYAPPYEREAATEGGGEVAEYAECSPASERGASACRYVAVTLTVILLARHLVSVIMEEPDHYAFTLFTVSSPGRGILLPFVIMSAIKGIQYSSSTSCSCGSSMSEGNGGPLQRGPREDELLQHHIIQIHS
ncbi:unnamed protein product [Spirodela intermedia]|uniref:RING-CH-type domain-containing protein n=1 Tax=Spirodela intermedia TaxID=51605 RepID=A0A7I8IAF5_SPIIN|nr:unnamed protein product [Spirodela intermedia]CAA6654393.1 unnamed protein product [Spirodela intermedia]